MDTDDAADAPPGFPASLDPCVGDGLDVDGVVGSGTEDVDWERVDVGPDVGGLESQCLCATATSVTPDDGAASAQPIPVSAEISPSSCCCCSGSERVASETPTVGAASALGVTLIADGSDAVSRADEQHFLQGGAGDDCDEDIASGFVAVDFVSPPSINLAAPKRPFWSSAVAEACGGVACPFSGHGSGFGRFRAE